MANASTFNTRTTSGSISLCARAPIPQICGKDFDLAPFLPIARKIAHEAVTDMRRYVQDASDIDNIIVSGDAAFVFKDTICSAFPHHEIQEGRDGLYANVRGFVRYGLWKRGQGERG